MAKMETCDTTCRIFTKAQHENFGEALVSDLVDLVPLLGDASALLRAKSLEASDSFEDSLSFLAYVVDSIPLVSEITSLFPLNVTRYLAKNHKLLPPPIPLPEAE